ncbi:hypothetical protein EI94DRAFT_1814242 [Lactarius quietus]|nr:hypothetical protein EI94DRAFT_1814242 [Lactarius quietus]
MAGKMACGTCGGHFRPQVFTVHIRKCERQKKEDEGQWEYDREMFDRAQAALAAPSSLGTPTIHEYSTIPEPDTYLDISDHESMAVPVSTTFNGIQTRYHPKSGRPATTRLVNGLSSAPPPSIYQVQTEPWSPYFETCEDFMISEVILDGCLGIELSDKLLRIIDLCITGKGKVTLKTFLQVQSAWERASMKLSPFKLSTTTVLYKGHELNYDVYHRSLWDWATDLVQSPQLAPHFCWDVERIFRCYEGLSIRVFNEPWSADDFWNVQSQIPTSGNPLCFILYTDKTRLSSFGMAQGYPVVVHCANLPTSIQNGNGFGGGRVVGWLPIVKEDPKETKKPEFITHKCMVWHQAFLTIVQSIVVLSKSGCWLECGDGVKRWLFPTVLMLSGDYEEQTVMALTHGSNAKFPCPRCLANHAELSDIMKTWPLRTAAETHELVMKARNTTCAQDREVLLSTQGVRNVNNIFWNLPLMDPYCTLSFDRLHSNNSGLFGYHFWGIFKTLIEGYGRQQVAQLDAQFHAVPRWSGLTHFREVMNVSFTDGSKYEDISKILVFVAHNIIPRSDKKGWALLCTLRSFSIVDLYLSFEETLKSQSMPDDGSLRHLEEYIDVSMLEATEDDPAKKWNFPKMHALVHSFNNIEAKGASRNYNMKPNEKMHGPLKKSYNFQINEIDKLNANTLTPDEQLPTHLDLLPGSLSTAQGRGLWGKVFYNEHILLHSQQPPATLLSFGDSFHIHLAKWLTAELKASNEGGEEMSYAIELSPSDNIIEYRSMKIVYESKVDQKQYINILHCSPNFHGDLRHDGIIVQTTKGFIFAQLILMFTVSIANTSYPICLVQPFDAPTGPQRVKNRDLGLRCVRARRNVTEFVFA